MRGLCSEAARRPGGAPAIDAPVIFSVFLIPHTLVVTTLGDLKPGDVINVEADLIGKYVARLLALGYGPNINKGGVSLNFLAEHGYT